ncbi:MAG: Glutamyl-tRNA(Gln) amidotransferase subunit [Paenibacillus sp.]|nr:Glutamyl-tRNA(Gln) amidotransferase subunit [Paenibacillus sp.]
MQMEWKDDWNAFVRTEGLDLLDLPLDRGGALQGLQFAVKDVYDIRGHAPGAGNPDWKRTHAPSAEHAATVIMLLEQGARLIGATHTDELMFGLNGENEHYGTPVNPRAPQRIPGGSSSGSAVAVASGLVDFAMGTDTAGSVRVPASYCGIYGMRPTYGRIPMQGIIPLAPAVDTAGWMARSLSVLTQVGEVLLQEGATYRPRETVGPTAGQTAITKLIWPSDMWALLDREIEVGARSVREKLRGIEAVHEERVLAEEGLGAWLHAFRQVQGFDIWRTHGDWIERNRPSFAADVAARFRWSSTIDQAAAKEARAFKASIETRLAEWLGHDTVLVVPSTPGIAPRIGLAGEEVEQRRTKTMQLCCPAGLAGLPQVTVPWLEHEGMPVGLSFIAGPGQDLRLLRWLGGVEEAVGLPVASH